MKRKPKTTRLRSHFASKGKPTRQFRRLFAGVSATDSACAMV